MAQAELTAEADVRLAIALPLASEEATVDELLDRTVAQIGSDDVVLCVLDNACKDDTRAHVEGYGRRDPRVRLVWAPEDRCVVDAYFRGYREAYDLGSQWILEMDGGLSHLPEEIPRFIAAMETGVDFAGGSRFIRGGSWRGSPWRWLVSRGGTTLANALLGTRMHDMTSGFECFSRAAMGIVLAEGVRSRAHFFQTEIRYRMHRLRWVEVPITYKNPSNRLGSSSIAEALRVLWALRAEERARRRACDAAEQGTSSEDGS